MTRSGVRALVAHAKVVTAAGSGGLCFSELSQDLGPYLQFIINSPFLDRLLNPVMCQLSNLEYDEVQRCKRGEPQVPSCALEYLITQCLKSCFPGFNLNKMTFYST